VKNIFFEIIKTLIAFDHINHPSAMGWARLLARVLT
jgi:hypothetical protein